jgi:putative transposase
VRKPVGFTAIKQEEMQSDLENMFRGAIRMTLETLLEEEVKNVIGVERYKRAVARKGQRNGSQHGAHPGEGATDP